MTGLTSLGIRSRGQPLTVVRPSRSPLIPNLNPQQLSRKVLVEAMFFYCQNHPSALEAVLEEARIRNEERQEISNRKRGRTMMKRFGEDSFS